VIGGLPATKKAEEQPARLCQAPRTQMLCCCFSIATIFTALSKFLTRCGHARLAKGLLSWSGVIIRKQEIRINVAKC
jgi:hypothetical protein